MVLHPAGSVLINLRYHLISLVAVFLALGLGVLFGVSFIDQSTVSGLRSAQERLGSRNNELRDQVVDLQGRNEGLNNFVVAARDQLAGGSLAGRPVIVVSFESTDEDTVRAVHDILAKAGSVIEGSFRLSNDLDLRNVQRRQQLASVLELTEPSVDTLAEAVIARLVASLTATEPGFLQVLIDTDFASIDEVAGSAPRPPAEIAVAGTAIVIVPAENRPALIERFTLPLARSLGAGGAITAVVQSGSENLTVVGPLRDEAPTPLITIDGIGTPAGQAALPLAIRAAYEGIFGHYGAADSAGALLPSTPPPPVQP